MGVLNSLRRSRVRPVGARPGWIVWAMVFVALPSFGAEPTPDRLALWPGAAPVGDGTTEAAGAFLTVHRPERANGAAVVICPGGGYGGLVTEGEGHGIARWLNGFGVTGLVLEYRLPGGRPMVPLLDARRALRTARARAGEWEIDPKRIGIIGFSAGGHLASSAATQFADGDGTAADPVERVSSRPDFAILVYPVITMGDEAHAGSRANLLGASPAAEWVARFSSERQVTERTPPVFLTHAVDDRVVPVDHSRMFAAALRQHSVPVELVELPSGGHGLNGYKGPMWDAWQTACQAWLAAHKFIESAPRSGEPGAEPAEEPAKGDETAAYETRIVEGWSVHVSRRLLTGQQAAVDVALPILRRQLEEIVRVVPEAAVARLRAVPLWFSPEYDGVPGRAEYHPSAGWLRDNGRPVILARGVEFTDTRNFEAEAGRMPNFTLHELAHAYHHQVLGFEQAGIVAAFEAARKNGLYDHVARRHGGGRPETTERAYAMTDAKEYFAELTEAYFSQNDFFPFTRAELEKHDPAGCEAVRRAWHDAR